MNRPTLYWGGLGATILAAGAAMWFLFGGTSNTPPSTPGSGFGVGDTRDISIPANNQNANNTLVSTEESRNKIFKLSDGPIAAATFVQTLRPTTTIARYALSESGHVLDVVLDSPGGVPRAVSNTTIPGVQRGLFVEGGSAALLQYLDGSVVKTVYVGFPSGTSTKPRPARIQFFPDNITDVAVSPDSKSVAYLLKSASGSDGYTARADGGGSKKLFSAPLSQLLVSWPTQNTLLLRTKSSALSLGALFSVSAQSGSIVPLMFAQGVSAIADTSFTYVVYQTTNAASVSYVRNMKTGKDDFFSFNPIPEKCVFGSAKTPTMYCAQPLEDSGPSYLDMWHQGVASLADSLFVFDPATGRGNIIATPGGAEGGVASDVASLAVSPDEKYLLFIKKGDRSLWAVRLD